MAKLRSHLAQVDPKTIDFADVKKRIEDKIKQINSYKPSRPNLGEVSANKIDLSKITSATGNPNSSIGHKEGNTTGQIVADGNTSFLTNKQSLLDKIDNLKSLVQKLTLEQEEAEKLGGKNLSSMERSSLSNKLLGLQKTYDQVESERFLLKQLESEGSNADKHLLNTYFSLQEQANLQQQLVNTNSTIARINNEILTQERLHSSEKEVLIDKLAEERLHTVELANAEKSALNDRIADLRELVMRLEQEKITAEKMAMQSVSHTEKVALIEKLVDVESQANKALVGRASEHLEPTYSLEMKEIKSLEEKIAEIKNFAIKLQEDLTDIKSHELQEEKIGLERVYNVERNNLLDKINDLKLHVNKLEIEKQFIAQQNMRQNSTSSHHDNCESKAHENSVLQNLMQIMITKFTNNNSDNLMKDLVQYKLVNSLLKEDELKNHVPSSQLPNYHTSNNVSTDNVLLQNIFMELGSLSKELKIFHERANVETQTIKEQVVKTYYDVTKGMQNIASISEAHKDMQGTYNQYALNHNETLSKIFNFLDTILVKQDKCIASIHNVESYKLDELNSKEATLNTLHHLKEQQHNVYDTLLTLKQDVNHNNTEGLITDIKNLLKEVNERNLVLNNLIADGNFVSYKESLKTLTSILDQTNYFSDLVSQVKNINSNSIDLGYIQESLDILNQQLLRMENTILVTLDDSDDKAARRYISLSENTKSIQLTQRDNSQNLDKLQNSLEDIKNVEKDSFTKVSHLMKNMQLEQENIAHDLRRMISNGNFKDNSLSDSTLKDLAIYMQESKLMYTNLQHKLELFSNISSNNNINAEKNNTLSVDIAKQVKELSDKLTELKTYYYDSLAVNMQSMAKGLEDLKTTNGTENLEHKLDNLNKELAEFKKLTTEIFTDVATNKESTKQLANSNNVILTSLADLNSVLNKTLNTVNNHEGIVKDIQESLKKELSNIVNTMLESQALISQSANGVTTTLVKLDDYNEHLDKQLNSISTIISNTYDENFGNLAKRIEVLNSQDSQLNSQLNDLFTTVNQLKNDTLKLLDGLNINENNKDLLNDKLESMYAKIAAISKVIVNLSNDGVTINTSLKELLANTDILNINNNEVKQDVAYVRNRLQSLSITEDISTLNMKLSKLADAQKDLLANSNQASKNHSEIKDEINLLKGSYNSEIQDIASDIFHKLFLLEEKYKVTNDMFKNLNEEILKSLKGSSSYSKLAQQFSSFSKLHEEAVNSLNSNIAALSAEVRSLSSMGQLKNMNSSEISALHQKIDSLEKIQDAFFKKYHENTNQVISYIKSLEGNLFDVNLTKLSSLENKIQMLMNNIDNTVVTSSNMEKNTSVKKAINVNESLNYLNKEISEKIKKEKS